MIEVKPPGQGLQQDQPRDDGMCKCGGNLHLLAKNGHCPQCSKLIPSAAGRNGTDRRG